MNYLLHNLGYDKPINFRYIVLSTYKSRCMWLRDDYLDNLGLYDYTKWLPDASYEQSNLEHAKKSYKEAKIALVSLTEEKLSAAYEEELRKYEVLHNSTHSYHSDIAAKIKRCTEEYREHLDKWLAIPDTPNWLAGDLIEIYDTAIKDMKEHEADDVKAVESMHNQMPPTFEEFREKELKHLESMISWSADKIKSAKRAIKFIEKEREEVKQIFALLDQIDGGNSNETLD